MPIKISCGCNRKRDWFLGSYKFVNYTFSRPYINLSITNYIGGLTILVGNVYNNISVELGESGYFTVNPGDVTVTINASTSRRSLFLSVKPDGSCIHSYSGGEQSANQQNVKIGINEYNRTASITKIYEPSYINRSNGSKKVSYNLKTINSYQSNPVLPPFVSSLNTYLRNISLSYSYGNNTIDAFIDVFPHLKSLFPIDFLFSQLDGNPFVSSSITATLHPGECGFISAAVDNSVFSPFLTESDAYLEANITPPKPSITISDGGLKSIQNTTIQAESRDKNFKINGISPGGNYIEYVGYLLTSDSYSDIRLSGTSRHARVRAPFYKYFIIRAFELKMIHPRYKIIETSIKECNIGEEIEIPESNIDERVSILFPNPAYLYNILYIQPTSDSWQEDLAKFYDSTGDSIISCLFNDKSYVKYINIDLPYGVDPEYQRYDDLPFLTEENIFSIFGDPFNSSYLGSIERSSSQVDILWADGVKKFIPDPD